MVDANPANRNKQNFFDRIMVLAESLGRQTHSGTTMMIAAALDRLLETALTSKMTRDSREVRDSLFGEFGVLRAFSAKIELSFAMGIVDRQAQRQLTMIRKVRNTFAHTDDLLTFESEAVQTVIVKALGTSQSIGSIEDFIAVAKAVESTISKESGLPHSGQIEKLKNSL
jgi:DNA-binding MltR family transcriptional regulator